MKILNRISKKELRDLLGKGWLTHDGMWFYHTYQALGIETANEVFEKVKSASYRIAYTKPTAFQEKTLFSTNSISPIVRG